MDSEVLSPMARRLVPLPPTLNIQKRKSQKSQDMCTLAFSIFAFKSMIFAFKSSGLASDSFHVD